MRLCAWFETVWMSKGCAVVSRCYKYNVWFSHDYSNSMTVRVVNASCYLIQPLWKDYVYTEIYTAYLCYIRTSFRLLDEYFVMLGWHTTNLYLIAYLIGFRSILLWANSNVIMVVSCRRGVWEQNLVTIRKHNLEADRGVHTFWLGMNEYGDMVGSSQWFTSL